MYKKYILMYNIFFSKQVLLLLFTKKEIARFIS